MNVERSETPYIPEDKFHPAIHIYCEYVGYNKYNKYSNINNKNKGYNINSNADINFNDNYNFNYKKANFEAIVIEILLSNWYEVIEVSGVDNMVEQLYEYLLLVVKEHTPLIGNKTTVTKFSVWFSRELIQLINRKNYLLKKVSKVKKSGSLTGNLSLSDNIEKINYMKLIIKNSIKNNNKHHIGTIENNAKLNPQEIWSQ